MLCCLLDDCGLLFPPWHHYSHQHWRFKSKYGNCFLYNARKEKTSFWTLTQVLFLKVFKIILQQVRSFCLSIYYCQNKSVSISGNDDTWQRLLRASPDKWNQSRPAQEGQGIHCKPPAGILFRFMMKPESTTSASWRLMPFGLWVETIQKFKSEKLHWCALSRGSSCPTLGTGKRTLRDLLTDTQTQPFMVKDVLE